MIRLPYGEKNSDVKDSATFLWISRGEGIVLNRRPHALPDRVDQDDRPAGCLVHKTDNHRPEHRQVLHVRRSIYTVGNLPRYIIAPYYVIRRPCMLREL